MKPLSTHEKKTFLWLLALGVGLFLAAEARDYLEQRLLDWTVRCVTEHHQTALWEVQRCVDDRYATPAYRLLRAVSFGALFVVLPLLVERLANERIKNKPER